MKTRQPGNALLLIRPANFGFNEETYASNPFQSRGTNYNNTNSQKMGLNEFDNLIDTLRKNDIETIVFEDTATPVKPDAIFSNNWISIIPGGELIIYPMLTLNRKTEIRQDIIKYLQENYNITDTIDLSQEKQVLEGTGSLVFDHDFRTIYCSLSERSNRNLLLKLCDMIDYTPVFFEAMDLNQKPIYHTNVLLCITPGFVIICLETLKNKDEQDCILNKLKNANKHIIEISYRQMIDMCANTLSVLDQSDNECLVMSTKAYKSFTKTQLEQIQSRVRIIHSEIQHIENVGGGGIRCMLTSIHLAKVS
ncbi:MAG: hypothetical protein JKY42_08315 [Flavobacteriales bacterium]|nr:hypothetical protein [Flavobacteriales bacterium]